MALSGFLTAQIALALFYALTIWGIPESPYTKYFGATSETAVESWMASWFAFGLTINAALIAHVLRNWSPSGLFTHGVP